MVGRVQILLQHSVPLVHTDPFSLQLPCFSAESGAVLKAAITMSDRVASANLFHMANLFR